jgi:hypothetical protein
VIFIDKCPNKREMAFSICPICQLYREKWVHALISQIENVKRNNRGIIYALKQQTAST